MWREDGRYVTVKGVVGASWRASRSEDAKTRTRKRSLIWSIKRLINPRWCRSSLHVEAWRRWGRDRNWYVGGPRKCCRDKPENGDESFEHSEGRYQSGLRKGVAMKVGHRSDAFYVFSG